MIGLRQLSLTRSHLLYYRAISGLKNAKGDETLPQGHIVLRVTKH